MNENITKYTESFKIRANEVDTHGKATFSALCSLFQEVAGNHALKLNFDITQLQEQDLTWVLHRMDIEIYRFPEWREKILIETWPAAGDALRAYRDYKILDNGGNTIGVCLSYWMMINIKTRRPSRMPKEVLNMRLTDIDHVLEPNNNRLRPFNESNHPRYFEVRNSDLDMNDHVNNARYVEWVMEHYSNSNPLSVKAIDIQFLRESVSGDEITSDYLEKDNDTYLHQLKNQDDEVLVLARCKSKV
ncbi:acyl-[acyl-carrier-protein] thioesterase [Gracilimonas sp. Q87]|uniref:acyl-[acyl-carrier-protein] thioesterase n=1 Tax=Gracilimonas sp. Q87 TaxID=3384766 RepID=UPI0039841C76